MTASYSVAVAALALGLPVGVAGAQAPERLPGVGAEVVRVDVVVTAKGGKPRLGLTAKDFVVLEDGQPQAIVRFESFGSAEVSAGSTTSPPPQAGAPAPAPAPSAPPRTLVLAVDDLHLEFSNLARTRKALSRFLDQELGASDRVALVTTSGAVGVDLGADRVALKAGIERLSPQDRRMRPMRAPYLTEYQAEAILRNDPEAIRLAVDEIMNERRTPTAEDEARVYANAMVANFLETARATLETLVRLVQALGRLPGRKIVVFASDGFLTGLALPGGEAFDLQRVTDAATRAGVVLYSLDTRGLVAGNSAAATSAQTRTPITMGTASFGTRDSLIRQGESAVRDAMNALAVDTGGLFVEDSNDLGRGLRRILKDTETYYAIAYEPANPNRDGAFRKIEVRLPGVRDVRIRARKGYYAPDDRKGRTAPLRAAAEPPPPAGAPAPDPVADINAALSGADDLSALPVRLFADFMSVDGVGAQLVLSGGVDSPCPAAPGCPSPSLLAAGAIYDEAGGLVGSLALEPLAASLVYQKAVPVKPGRYRARLAVREESNRKIGSASTWVTIPDLSAGGLRLSSVFLSRRDEASPGTAAAGELSLASAQGSRRFKPTESLFAQVYAYNPGRAGGGPASLVTSAEIWRDGVKLGATPPEPLEAGALGEPPIPYTRSFKLASFTPADYELRFVVTDRVAGTVATSQVGFTVE